LDPPLATEDPKPITLAEAGIDKHLADKARKFAARTDGSHREGNPAACLSAKAAGLPHVEDLSRTITGKLGFPIHICVIAVSAARVSCVRSSGKSDSRACGRSACACSPTGRKPTTFSSRHPLNW
jgi:hypothetical protein